MRRALKIIAMLVAVLVLGSLMFDARDVMLRFVDGMGQKIPEQTIPVKTRPDGAAGGHIAAPPPLPAETFSEQIGEILLNQKHGEARTKKVLEIFGRWVRADAEGAMTWAEEALDGDERLGALRQGMGDWAKRDISAAALWAERLTPDHSQAEALEALMGVWGASAPMQAARWLTEQAPNAATDRAAQALARAWAQNNFLEAAAWAEAQAATGALTPGGIAIIRGVAQADPVGTAQWAASVTDETVREGALGATFETWGKQQPLAAAQFLAAQQSQSPAAFRAVASEWVKSNAAGASHWLQGQPDGAARDAAVEGFTRSLVAYDAASALTWAMSVSDGEARAVLTRDLMDFWMSDDPEAAVAFARENGLGGEAGE